MNKHHILVVGAHCGDAEIQAGAIVKKYTKAGHKATFLHLTAGEKGNPPHIEIDEYRKQKIEESEKAAAILGADTITLDFKDAELEFNNETVTSIAELVRKIKPTLCITHWTKSIHPDHVLSPQLMFAAWLKAALPGFELNGLPAHGMRGILHSENWEDMEEYVPDIFVDVSDEFEDYLKAISQYWFVMNSSSFKYYDYYKALGTVRGCLNRCKFAQTLKYPIGTNLRKGKEIPGFNL